MWVDPKNPNRIWMGEDGGIAVSYDRAETWECDLNFAIGQFYQVFADNRWPFYYLSGGLQDNGSWTGPSRTQHRRHPQRRLDATSAAATDSTW